MRKISVRLLAEMIKYGNKIDLNQSWSFDFPVFVLMSGMEKIVDGRKTEAFLKKLESPLKGVKSFPGFYHEIFNELGQAEVFATLINYLRQVRSFYAKR